MLLTEMKMIARAHNIRGCKNMAKHELHKVLNKKGLIPEQEYKEGGSLSTIRRNPRAVTLTALKTIGKLKIGGSLVFPSIYQAAKLIERNPAVIQIHEGKDWNGMYHVTIEKK